jgi:sulfite exporter TauE/SafE
MMIGKNRFRYFYFLGRLFSYTIVGAIAGGFGAVLNIILHTYSIPAAASLLFGTIILMAGLCTLLNWKIPIGWLRGSGKISNTLTLLLLREQPLPTFLFGFFTVLLPCGQTLIVFSACALSGSAVVGAINGAAFALLTSPSLWFSMHMQGWMGKWKGHYDTWMGAAAVIVGVISIARGLADLELIEHLSYHMTDAVHLVLY